MSHNIYIEINEFDLTFQDDDSFLKELIEICRILIASIKTLKRKTPSSTL